MILPAYPGKILQTSPNLGLGKRQSTVNRTLSIGNKDLGRLHEGNVPSGILINIHEMNANMMPSAKNWQIFGETTNFQNKTMSRSFWNLMPGSRSRSWKRQEFWQQKKSMTHPPTSQLLREDHCSKVANENGRSDGCHCASYDTLIQPPARYNTGHHSKLHTQSHSLGWARIKNSE